MKKLSLLVLPLLFCFHSNAVSLHTYADSGKVRIIENQLGLNATNFIQTLASLSGNTFASSPYSVNYKLLIKTPEGSFLDAVGPRIGYGRRRVKNETQASSSSTRFSNDEKEVSFRLGGEMQKQLSRFWTVYIGLDYTFNDVFEEAKSTFNWGFGEITTTTTTDGRNEGFGPVLGVQFNVSKYICLSTELTMYTVAGSTTTSTTSTNPNSFDQYSIEKRKTGSIVLPSFINFSFRF